MFMPFTLTQVTTVHFMTVSLTLWLRYSQYDKAVFFFVGDANAYHY